MQSMPESAARRMDIVASLLSPKSAINDSVDPEVFLVNVLKNDPDGIVRHEAAFVLGHLYERGRIQGDQALLALCEVAKNDPSIVARHEAAESLSSFPHSAATAALRELLDDPIADVAATARIAIERQAASDDSGELPLAGQR